MQQIARQRRPHLKPVKTQQLRCGFCSVTNKHLLATLHITITYKANTIITFLPSAHHFEMRQRTRVRMVAKIGEWDHGRDAAGVRARSLGRRGMLTRLVCDGRERGGWNVRLAKRVGVLGDGHSTRSYVAANRVMRNGREKFVQPRECDVHLPERPNDIVDMQSNQLSNF